MHTESVQRVLIVGLGTMGQQVALECARHGLDVTLYDVSSDQAVLCRKNQAAQLRQWIRDGRVDAAAVSEIMRLQTFAPDADSAARDCDLLIECVSEDRALKTRVFAQFDRICPARTIFATNTSYLIPSMMVKSLERADRFAALHFHDPVWYANVVDIMPHPRTSAETLSILEGFARRIGQIPILCGKERPGYVFNSMLQAFLASAIGLAVDGMASIEDIDRSWMGVLKTPIGPFGILDRIGLDTVHDIVQYWIPGAGDARQDKARQFIQRWVEAGRLGVKTGSGFYQYPNPAYESPNFLTSGGQTPLERSRES